MLGFTDEEAVEKRRQRLGVRGRGTAADDERMMIAALSRPQRNAAQVQKRQAVGPRQLKLQRHADDIEVRQRPRRLQGVQRQLVATQLGLHIDPRRKRALAQDARVFVQQRVQDLGAQVGHADLVHIGKGQRQPQLDGVPVFANRLILAAQVARGLLYRANEVCIRVFHPTLVCRTCSEVNSAVPGEVREPKETWPAGAA